MSKEVEYTCPHCKKKLKFKLKDMLTKRKTKCSNCNGEITFLKERIKKDPKGLEQIIKKRAKK